MSIAKNIVFRTLNWLPLHIPDTLRPLVRATYEQATRLSVVRRLIWWSSSVDKCHKYWSNPSDEHNKPATYLAGGAETSALLLHYVNRYANRDSSILEIGCNAGRNLWMLFQEGYPNLTGVEINPRAVSLMKMIFPSMTKHIIVHNCAVEDVIKAMPDNCFDIVYTVAVLEHIHSDSSWLFSEMTRISRRYIITLENEATVSWRIFPRDYGRIFEGLGMTMVEVNDCRKLPDWYGIGKLRVFKK